VLDSRYLGLGALPSPSVLDLTCAPNLCDLRNYTKNKLKKKLNKIDSLVAPQAFNM